MAAGKDTRWDHIQNPAVGHSAAGGDEVIGGGAAVHVKGVRRTTLQRDIARHRQRAEGGDTAGDQGSATVIRQAANRAAATPKTPKPLNIEILFKDLLAKKCIYRN